MDNQQSWQRCQEQFLASIYHRSQSIESLRSYRHILTTFFKDYPKPPDKVTRADVEQFLERPSSRKRDLGKPPATATRNLRLCVLKSFYAYAATYLVEGPDGSLVPLLQRPAPTIGMHSGKPAQSYRALDAEEVKRFFAVIPQNTIIGLRDRALFLCYFYSARRRQEVLNLRWGDIEQATIMENGQARQGTMYHFYGKGHSQKQDTAELPAPAYQAIITYLEASGRLATIQPDEPIFVAVRPPRGGGYKQQGKIPLSNVTPAYIMKAYAKKAGIDYRHLSTHVWRHSSARMRYELGSDIREIQQLLRHASLQTTDVYLRQLTGTADPGSKLLEEKFGSL